MGDDFKRHKNFTSLARVLWSKQNTRETKTWGDSEDLILQNW